MSLDAVARFQEYGIVTVQVAVVPERVAKAAASSRIIVGAAVILSITLALTEHAIFAVAAIVAFTVIVTAFALSTDASIYKMVENAYKVTLVGAFVPLVCGLYWKRSTNLGAMLAIVLGLLVWIGFETLKPEGVMPPQLAGLIASFAGMIVGSLALRSLQREATT